MESKPELTDRSTDALSNAQVALIDKDDGHSAFVRLDSTVQI